MAIVCLLLVVLAAPGLGAGVAIGQGAQELRFEARPVLTGGPDRALIWQSPNEPQGARVLAAIPAQMPPTRLGPASRGSDGQPAVADRGDGSTWVVASRAAGAGSRLWVYAARRVDDRWSLPERLPQPSGEPMAPAIAVDGDGLPAVVWAAEGVGHAEIWVSWRGDRGWSAPLALTADETPDVTPTIAVSGRRWIVAWSAFRERAYWTEAAVGHPRRGWQTPQIVSRRAGSSPLALASDDQLSVVWVVPESSPWSTRSVVRRSYLDTGGWQRPEDVVVSANANIAAVLDADGALRLGWKNLRAGLTVAESVSPVSRAPLPELRVVLGRGVDVAAADALPPTIVPKISAATRWLAFGDSITQGYTLIGGSPAVVGGYPAGLQARLGGAAQVFNSGVGGETTVSGIGRFNGAFAGTGANGAVIMEGTNDISAGFATSVTSFNLQQMASTARGAGAATLIAMVLPRNEEGFGGAKNAATNELNGRIPGAAGASGASVAYTHGGFVGRGDLFADDKHPTSGGYDFLAGIIFATINALPPDSGGDDGGGGGVCTFTMNPASANFAPGGGSGSIALTTQDECTWDPTSNRSWISINSTQAARAQSAGSGTVTYSVEANGGSVVRYGTISLGGAIFTVRQEAEVCTYSVTPTSQAVVAAGGTYTTRVTAGEGCAWTATSNASWLDIVSGSSGSGDGEVRYEASANGAGLTRSGTLTVAGVTAAVNQAAAPCTYAASVVSQSFTAQGGTGSFGVTTLVGCQ